VCGGREVVFAVVWTRLDILGRETPASATGPAIMSCRGYGTLARATDNAAQREPDLACHEYSCGAHWHSRIRG
jgi:hypothetical protein